MQEDVDTCRICSAPAEPEAPLFHPCKCSGTIRYIHQDCLTTWLAHSKKKTCDVCKYQYSFTKVYLDTMPKQIPLILFLRKFIQKVFWGVILGLRGIMVATIWLALLPYVTVWTWRFYFVMGENVAWWTYDKPRPHSSPAFYSYLTNLTYSENVLTKDSNVTVMDFVTSYPAWRALSSDIFTGQIIASVIVLLFLGVFLLREWIMQNARPGVFEEDIHQEEVEVPDAPMEAENQQDIPALEVIPDHAHVGGTLLDTEDTDSAPIAVDEAEATRTESFGTAQASGVDQSGSARGEIRPLRRKRRILDDDSTGDDETIEPPGIRVRLNPRKIGASRSSSRDSKSSSGREDWGWTQLSATSSFRDSGNVSLEDYPFTFSSEALKQQSTQFAEPPPPLVPLTFAALETHNEVSRQASGSHSSPRLSSVKKTPLPSRPALPDINLSGQEFQTDVGALPVTHSPNGCEATIQPQPSPSLSTYHAPEQLEGSTSLLATNLKREDYFPDADTPHDSDVGSELSSVAATVLESAFKEEEIDDYFGMEDDAGLDGVGLAEDDQAAVVEVAPPRQEAHFAENNDEDVDAQDEGAREAAEDVDGFNEDDVDGALEEAIGMRGPLSAVFQNAALVIFVLDTTIGLTIWAPFTIGKTFVLLSLDPPRMLHVLNSPIRLIRLATDPIVDFCIFAVKHSTKSFLHPLGMRETASPWNMAQPSVFTSIKTTLIRKLLADDVEAKENALTRGLEHLANSPTVSFLEPHFASLGKEVRTRLESAKVSWIELANGEDSASRIFAILLGYVLAAFLLAIYLNVLTVGSVQSAGRAIRNAIRQQLVVLKVVVFISIELVFFPLGCGVMLDVFTMELFPNTTISTRLAFFQYAPMTSIFYHWMVGTMFMYQFAILLGGCRKILRQGALWFIRDPQDQNFHPIRDILERSTFVQLRKLAMSAVMYSIVVALGMGGLVFSLRVWGSLILPLRWKTREPLAAVPIDLLFMHVVMPYTIKYFRPRRYATSLARDYWGWAARLLRLTSYLFGEMRVEETRPPQNLKSFICDALGITYTDVYDEQPPSDGRYRRVPAQDNISIPREVSATAAVNELGEPIDEAASRLIALQDAEAVRAKRDPAKDYTTVYLPPRFRERVVAFMALIWLAGSFVSVAAFVVPTLFGRAMFELLLKREVHDGYSFVLGLYLLYGCFYAAHVLDRMDKRRQRTNEDGPKAEWAVYVFKRSILWTGHFVWVAFWLGFVIPTLIGLVMECYVVHPIRLVFQPHLTLHIRIFETWAFGLVYTKIALFTKRLRPETRMDSALKELRENGWRRLDAVPVTLDIILPVVIGLAGMLLLPLGLVLGLKQVVPNKVPSNILFLAVYPGLFLAATVETSVPSLRRVLNAWSQQIRDSEFLVEMRLRNLEQPEPRTGDSSLVDTSESQTPTPDTTVDAVEA